jgi:hypothetical protein
MPLLVAKHTFLSFVEDGKCDEDDEGMRPQLPQGLSRSKSADTARSRPIAEEHYERSQMSIQRLNTVLSIGMSPSAAVQLPTTVTQVLEGDACDEIVEGPSTTSPNGLTELMDLKKMLGKALSENPTPVTPKVMGTLRRNSIRNASNCSISTMVTMLPDDSSECGELPSAEVGKLTSGSSTDCDDTMNQSQSTSKTHRRKLSNRPIGTVAPPSTPGHGERTRMGRSKMPKSFSSNAVSSMAFSVDENSASTVGSLRHMRRPSNHSVSSVSLEGMESGAMAQSGSNGMTGMRKALSSNSVSGMALDYGNEVLAAGGLNQSGMYCPSPYVVRKTVTEAPRTGGMRKAFSSNAVSTMVNDIDDCFAEDGELRNRSGEFLHGLVPRTQNLQEMYNKTSKDAPPTTMMIRNIPSRYSQQDLVLDLKELGFTSTFDFLYIPMDQGTSANVGYAFVNFISPTWAAKCMDSFQNYRFSRQPRGCNKTARVSVAHIQGLDKNLQHYENSAVNASRTTSRRPMVIANIAKVFG